MFWEVSVQSYVFSVNSKIFRMVFLSLLSRLNLELLVQMSFLVSSEKGSVNYFLFLLSYMCRDFLFSFLFYFITPYL